MVLEYYSRQPHRPRLDVIDAIKDVFRSVEQYIMTECTFRQLIAPLIEQERNSYTVLLKLWEENNYITVVRKPGHPRLIELGSAHERDYYCW